MDATSATMQCVDTLGTLVNESRSVLDTAAATDFPCRPLEEFSSQQKVQALIGQKQFVDALELIDKALTQEQPSCSIYRSLGSALKGLGRFEDAIEAFNTACYMSENPDECLCDMGDLYMDLKDYEQAVNTFRSALCFNPDHPMARSIMALALWELDCTDEAYEQAKAGVDRAPTLPRPYYVLGLLSLFKNLLDEGIAFYEKAIDNDPESAIAHTALGVARLTRLEFDDKTFRHYDWRFKRHPFEAPPPHLADLPRWDGNPVGAKVLVWAEQGLGDVIFSLRYIPHLGLNSDQIVLCTDQRLVSISERSLLGVSCTGEWPSNAADLGITHQLSGCSALEYVVPRLSEVQRCPFIGPDEKLVNSFKSQLNCESSCLKIGISWFSNRERPYGRSKSTDLLMFSTLAELDNVQLVDLQYGDTDAEIQDFEMKTGFKILRPDLDRKNDIESLAALITACDYVVTVSNVTAHITGALAKQGFVLLPAGKGLMWFWHRETEQSSWYPTLRLVRQSKHSDWSESFQKIKHDLLEMAL